MYHYLKVSARFEPSEIEDIFPEKPIKPSKLSRKKSKPGSEKASRQTSTPKPSEPPEPVASGSSRQVIMHNIKLKTIHLID